MSDPVAVERDRIIRTIVKLLRDVRREFKDCDASIEARDAALTAIADSLEKDGI